MKKAFAALALSAAIAGSLVAQESGGGIEFGLKGIFLDASSINANVSGGLSGLVLPSRSTLPAEADPVMP